MEAQVDQFVNRHQLIPHGSTIVVGVSGGPDSMALLHYLLKKSTVWKLNIIACCVNHQLRGEESRDDLAFVSAYCQEKNVIFEGRSVDVLRYKSEHRMGTEEAARMCRYHVFEEVMEDHSADLLALAHHGDDQIETMLMRQVRGSFGLSKAGIPVRRPFARGEVVRPFLSITKDDIKHYCVEFGISSRHDPSNDSDLFTRNRFRKFVLPFLKKENPQVHLRFQLESERMTDDYQFLDELATEALPTIIKEKTATFVRLSINCLKDAPVPLQRRMIHLILNYLYKQARVKPKLKSIHIDSFLHWLGENTASGSMDFPDHLEAHRSYDQCIVRFRQHKEVSQIRLPVNVPGMTEWPTGCIQAEISHTYSTTYHGNNHFICDYNKVRFPLFIRYRQSGDRLSPKGMEGTKKVKALFIDQKVPRQLRELWPIIVDGEGRIIWVPLLRHSDYANIDPSTSNYLILNYEPIADFRRML